VLNRLGFKQAITSATTPEQRQFIPTSEAPLQKFHWVHFPPDVKPGTFTYKATAMLFQPGSETALTAGPSAEVGVVLMPLQPGPFQLGFTRGYISSQAYAEQFHNAPIEPSPPTFNFDTSPYQAQYQWLGFHAHRLMFDFVAETLADQGLSLDVFAYDIQLVDHYRFRAVMQTATDAQPLQLQGHSAHWASAYYTPGNPKVRERTLLARH
jgi:hypothetical protein